MHWQVLVVSRSPVLSSYTRALLLHCSIAVQEHVPGFSRLSVFQACDVVHLVAQLLRQQ